jgi:ABC-2 type transport system ATP-binding protein
VSGPSQLSTDAEAVRRAIAGDVQAGSAALAEFSRRYARTPEHKNAALALKAGAPGIEDPLNLVGLRGRLMDILGAIVAECARGDERIEQALEARKQLFGRFRRDSSRQETVCRVEGLEKRYRRSGFVMGPVSCQLRTGEITAVVGENAHGKTTLLRTVIGELRPTTGRIAFPALSPGPGVHWAAVRSYVGYLPQKLPDWHGSLADALHFQAALRGLSPAENEMQVEYLVARLDLAEHMAKRWSELSGGFQLRFSLAQALVGRPRLLVLDEPLANLDPRAQAAVLWDIRNLATSTRSPMTVVISSQALDPLEAASDNVVFLRNGQVVFQGPTGAIGAERSSNLYECDTSLSPGVLQERIGAHVTSITHNGVHYLIRTPIGVSYTDLLRLLEEADVEFTHCRDIGRKVMGLFDWD